MIYDIRLLASTTTSSLFCFLKKRRLPRRKTKKRNTQKALTLHNNNTFPYSRYIYFSTSTGFSQYKTRRRRRSFYYILFRFIGKSSRAQQEAKQNKKDSFILYLQPSRRGTVVTPLSRLSLPKRSSSSKVLLGKS